MTSELDNIAPAAGGLSDSDAESRGRFMITQRLNEGLKDSPDDAADAFNISRITNGPPAYIKNNLDDVRDGVRQSTAQAMVLDNPALVAYIASHPLAASISGDDWANLDEYTAKSHAAAGLLNQLHQRLSLPDQRMGEGFQEGWGEGEFGQEPLALANKLFDPAKHQFWWGATGTAAMVLEGLLRGTSALAEGAAGFAGGVAETFGGPQLGREAKAMSEWALTRGDMPLDEAGPMRRVTLGEHLQLVDDAKKAGLKPKLTPQQEALQAGMPWFEAGLEPPAGVHPELDKQKAALNSVALDQVEEILQAAANTETRARSPEMFEKIRTAVGDDVKIGIQSEVALALYGDKVPHAQDGLLGWIPNIAEQLGRARELGSDIEVSLNQLAAHADPAVFKQLRNGVRAYPNGITELEAKEIPTEPRELTPSALASLRATSGLDPAFGPGDRKVALEAVEDGKFTVSDEHGQPVGELHTQLGPDGAVLIDSIQGSIGVWGGLLGPAAIRDFKRQISEAFPNAKEIGSVADPSLRVPIYSETPTMAEHQTMHTIMDTAYKNDLEPFYAAIGRDASGIDWYDSTTQTPLLPEHAKYIPDFTNIRRPGEALSGSATNIPSWFEKLDNTFKELSEQLGLPYTPKLWVGTPRDAGLGGMFYAIGHIVISDFQDEHGANFTGLHEFGHAVEGMLFSTETEAIRQAIVQAWMVDKKKSYTVEQIRPLTSTRYPEPIKKASAPAYMIEFHEWFAEQVSRWITMNKQPTGAVEKFFHGIAQVWKKIYAKITGKPNPVATEVDAFMRKHWKDIEPKVDVPVEAEPAPKVKPSPTAGASGGGDGAIPPTTTHTPAEPEPIRPSNAQQILDVAAKAAAESTVVRKPSYGVEGLDALRAGAVRLPQVVWDKIKARIVKQHESDIAANLKQAHAEQKRRQTQEWKDNRVEVAKQAAKDIRQRPDIGADLFLGSGELFGKKLRQRYTLATDSLTPEQIAMVPDHYVSKNGVPAETVAQMFGYETVDDLMNGLGNVEKAKTRPNGTRMQMLEFMRQIIDDETTKRMERLYGNLDRNIMDAAQDQALSEATLNVKLEELEAAAQQAGISWMGKEAMKVAARNWVDTLIAKDANSFKLMQLGDKHARLAQTAMAKDDWAAATKAMEMQTLVLHVAKEAKRVEREVKDFEKQAKRWSKREVKSMEPEYTNWIHDILSRVGRTVKRSARDLDTEIDASGEGNTLADFIANKSGQGQLFDVWDQLYDPAWAKQFDKLTVPEFRGVKGSLESIAWNGRMERKLIKAGELVDHQLVVGDLVSTLADFPAGDEHVGEQSATVARMGSGVLARVKQIEYIMNHWDKGNRWGAWNQEFFRPLAEGANQMAVWEKEVGGLFKQLQQRKKYHEAIPNGGVWKNSITGADMVMTRENLWTIMLNSGTESNLKKIAGGYGLKPEHVKAWLGWLEQRGVLTKEDWDFVQGIWDLLKKPKDWSDNMYRQLSGAGVPAQTLDPVAVHTSFGRYEGGYYPIIHHADFLSPNKKLNGFGEASIFDPTYTHGFYPSAGYTKERTRDVSPLALDMDRLPGRIKQVIRDAALRPALVNAAKIMRDGKVTTEIGKRFGPEYVDLMRDYLHVVAQSRMGGGLESKWQRTAMMVSEMARTNLIGTLVGWNPGTVLKHAPTAAVLSMNEVGAKNFARWVGKLFSENAPSGDSWYKFAMKNSEELQRRDRNWEESLFGASADTTGSHRYRSLQEKMRQLGSKPIALSDLASAVPTWLAAYEEAFAERGTHGDAVYAADRAVRRAHGSTAVTSQPLIMHSMSPWFTSVYNFFNDVANRNLELLWKAGEVTGRTDIAGMPDKAKLSKELLAGAVSGVLFPIMIENLVEPPEVDKNTPWYQKLAMEGFLGVAHQFPGVRDFASFLMGNDSPDVGLLTSLAKKAGELPKDIGEVVHDYNSGRHMTREQAEKTIRHIGDFAGLLTGGPGQQVGRWVGAAYGLASGIEHPRGPWGWLVLGRYGTLKGHSQSGADYLAGRYDRRR